MATPKGFTITVSMTEDEAKKQGAPLGRLATSIGAEIASRVKSDNVAVDLIYTTPHKEQFVWRTDKPFINVSGVDVVLPKRDRDLLAILLAAEDYVSLDTIGDLLASRGYLSSHAHIRVQINRLRNRLGVYGDCIVAGRSLGYRFKPMLGMVIE
jgi:DNA-binding response OmpR family regulator